VTASGDRGEGRCLVETIVCAYSREELPVSWLQVFHRFERAVARAGLGVRVRLLPLEELPETYEVLVVAPQLLRRAEALGTEVRILSVTREQAHEAARGLVRDLASGGSIYALAVRPEAPRTVVHRGSEEL